MTQLFTFGWFQAHSGLQLPWKIDCDALTDDDLAGMAQLISWKFGFSEVFGVPTGGLRLADACRCYCNPGYGVLIVDDVLTTGQSMEKLRESVMRNRAGSCIGVVIVARCPKDGAAISVPNWVFPILTVNDWAQSRATGLG